MIARWVLLLFFAGSFAIPIYLARLTFLHSMTLMKLGKDPYLCICVYGSRETPREIIDRFNEEYDADKCARVGTFFGTHYVTPHFLIDMTRSIQVLDLDAVLWADVKLKRYRNYRYYNLYFHTARNAGGAKSPMKIEHADMNRLSFLFLQLPFYFGPDKELRKLLRKKKYDLFEAKCLSRRKTRLTKRSVKDRITLSKLVRGRRS